MGVAYGVTRYIRKGCTEGPAVQKVFFFEQSGLAKEGYIGRVDGKKSLLLMLRESIELETIGSELWARFRASGVTG